LCWHYVELRLYDASGSMLTYAVVCWLFVASGSMLKLNLSRFFVVKRGVGRASTCVSSAGCVRACALCHAAVAAVAAVAPLLQLLRACALCLVASAQCSSSIRGRSLMLSSSIRGRSLMLVACARCCPGAVSIRQHPLRAVSIRQHPLSIRCQHPSASAACSLMRD
jgi:hypothetical protein